MLKKTGVNFSGFYSSFSYIIEKGQKREQKRGVKGSKKGATKGDCE
jgi:hypothetical protein